MAEPTGWDTREPLCGENDPFGREDTANKYARTLWENFNTEHDSSDGGHPFSVTCAYEAGTYTGTGSSKTVDLITSNLLITQIFIAAEDTERPTYYDGSATYITDIATAGEFTVNTNAKVNGSGVEYYFAVWGVLQ